MIHCGLLQSSAVVDLLPRRWFHYPEIIVITIKSPFINCHINYPPCCLLIWNLLSSWYPGAHFIPNTNPVSSLESCKRWTWLLWHTNILSVLLWRCLLIVQSSDRFGNASVYSSRDSWFCWTDWPFVKITFTFLFLPCDSHTFFGFGFFLVLSFHLPVQLLFSFPSCKLPLLGYLPSYTVLSCGITFSVFLLCHLQVPKGSLPFLTSGIGIWFFHSLLLLCVS